MLTQEQLIIKLLWETKLSNEEKKILKKDSLTVPFIANAIEKHLIEVKFIPDVAIELKGPWVEGCCIEYRQKKYAIPFINFKFIITRYIVHECGPHGEKRKKAYKSLLPALKYYIHTFSYGSLYLADLKIKT